MDSADPWERREDLRVNGFANFVSGKVAMEHNECLRRARTREPG
jgi:hypothetical protein